MGAVDTTYTFTATDTITSAKMNNIIDQTTITTDAIIGTTLDVASGKLKIRSSGITSNEMGASSVTATAIANGAVTPAKLSAAGPVWTTDTTNVGNGASGTYYFQVSPNRIGDGEAVINLGTTVGNNSNSQILRQAGANNSLVIKQFGTGGTVFQNPNSSVFFEGPNGFSLINGANSSNFPVPAGTAPIYGCRAWVSFNGIGSVGANMTIRSQGNVSSVNKLGTGRYRVTFATAMPDANYATITGSDANSPHKIAGVINQTSTYVDIAYSQINTSTARDDPDWGQVTIIR